MEMMYWAKEVTLTCSETSRRLRSGETVCGTTPDGKNVHSWIVTGQKVFLVNPSCLTRRPAAGRSAESWVIWNIRSSKQILFYICGLLLHWKQLWIGFGEYIQFSLSHCTCEWYLHDIVLWLRLYLLRLCQWNKFLPVCSFWELLNTTERMSYPLEQFG